MWLVLVVLAVAVVVGWGRGGRVGGLSGAAFGAGWLLVVALAARLALASGVAPGPALVVAQLAPLGFAWVNRRLPGMPLVGLGAALNAAVVLANGAMPVAAAMAAGGRHRPLERGDALVVLADVMPVFGVLVSLGDLVLAAGLLVLVPALMRPTRGSSPASR